MDEDEKEWVEWLDFFYYHADFGPADGDVREILMDQYEGETGKACPAREDEED